MTVGRMKILVILMTNLSLNGSVADDDNWQCRNDNNAHDPGIGHRDARPHGQGDMSSVFFSFLASFFVGDGDRRVY